MLRLLAILPALAMALAGTAEAQDLNSAKAFIAGLYAPYTASGAGRRSAAADWTRWAEPSLAALAARSAELTPRDEVPALNGDPICGCQEARIRSVAIAVLAGGGDEVLGTATFTNLGRRVVVRIRIVESDGRWRITDIGSNDMPSLRAFLERDVAERTASRQERPAAAAPSAAPAGGTYCLRERGEVTTFAARPAPGGALAFGLSTWTARGSNFSVFGVARPHGGGWRFQETLEGERCTLDIARTADGGYALTTRPEARCAAHGGQGAAPQGVLTIPPGARVGEVTTELAGPEAFQRGECPAQPAAAPGRAAGRAQGQGAPPARQAAAPTSARAPGGGLLRPGVSTAPMPALAELAWDDFDLPSLLVIRFMPEKTGFAAGWSNWALGLQQREQAGQGAPWPPFFAAPSARPWQDRSAVQIRPDEMEAFRAWNLRRAEALPPVIVHAVPLLPPAAGGALRLRPMGMRAGVPRDEQRAIGIGFAHAMFLTLARDAEADAVDVPEAVAAGWPRAGLRLETRLRWTEPQRAEETLLVPGEVESLRVVAGRQVVWERRSAAAQLEPRPGAR